MTDTVTQTAEDALQLIRAAMREVSATAGALKSMRSEPASLFAVNTVAASAERLAGLERTIEDFTAALFCAGQEAALEASLSRVPQQRRPGD
jgi:hypothetical protein